MMPRRAPRDVSSEHRFRERRLRFETLVHLHADTDSYSHEGVTSQVSMSHPSQTLRRTMPVAYPIHALQQTIELYFRLSALWIPSTRALFSIALSPRIGKRSGTYITV